MSGASPLGPRLRGLSLLCLGAPEATEMPDPGVGQLWRSRWISSSFSWFKPGSSSRQIAMQHVRMWSDRWYTCPALLKSWTHDEAAPKTSRHLEYACFMPLVSFASDATWRSYSSGTAVSKCTALPLPCFLSFSRSAGVVAAGAARPEPEACVADAKVAAVGTTSW